MSTIQTAESIYGESLRFLTTVWHSMHSIIILLDLRHRLFKINHDLSEVGSCFHLQLGGQNPYSAEPPSPPIELFQGRH
jgi:hypothetical protein